MLTNLSGTSPKGNIYLFEINIFSLFKLGPKYTKDNNYTYQNYVYLV